MLKKDKKKFIADAYKALGKEEFYGIVDAMKNANPPVFSGISAGINTNKYMPTYTHSFTASANPSGHVLQLPMEDLETSDLDRIRETIENMMDYLYPPFEPEIVHTFDKDYFLPALKVLVYRDGEYYSPQQESVWKGMQLEARCESNPWASGFLMDRHERLGNHSAPDEMCDCGIYGSVNLEEVASYLNEGVATQLQRTWIANYGYDKADPIIRKKLCIIEPVPGAKVIICRKGWKASGAFISEIIDETISLEQVSNLLSIAWHREVDVRRLNENR